MTCNGRLAPALGERVPRLENVGGFELGAGGFLVSRMPEDAALILRTARDVAHA